MHMPVICHIFLITQHQKQVLVPGAKPASKPWLSPESLYKRHIQYNSFISLSVVMYSDVNACLHHDQE